MRNAILCNRKYLLQLECAEALQNGLMFNDYTDKIAGISANVPLSSL